MAKTQNKMYSDTVSDGYKPTSSIVPLDDSFTDARGEIKNLLLTSITSVARITSRKGTVRANHYHLTDWHYAFLEKGKILYFERPVGSTTVPEPIQIKPGMMFFTPPMVEHAMLFAEDTTFFTFARNIRTHENHESDLIRVSFISDEIATNHMAFHP